jgi:hypothetical protein
MTGADMKYFLILVLIPIFTTLSFAEDIGAVLIGTNHYLGASSSYEEISPSGLAIGLIAPVNFKRPVHVKLRAAFHGIDADQVDATDPKYLMFSNELLVGSKWIKNGGLALLPQVGLGFVAERYRISKGNGGSHGDFFIDLSCRVDIALADFSIGALVNFERDFNIGYGSFLSPNRLNMALVISK